MSDEANAGIAERTKHWDRMSEPPPGVLKTIGGGRLSGMTDIKPQWRYLVMTEEYGPCGVGWKYEIVDRWTDSGPEGERVANVLVHLYVKEGDNWSEPIPGAGGAMLIAKETRGLHVNDEAWKMATTDGLSVSMSRLGVGAAIYMGRWDGSKYKDPVVPARAASEDQEFRAADWRAALDETSDEALGEWWIENGDKVKESCGTVLASQIYDRYKALHSKVKDRQPVGVA